MIWVIESVGLGGKISSLSGLATLQICHTSPLEKAVKAAIRHLCQSRPRLFLAHKPMWRPNHEMRKCNLSLELSQIHGKPWYPVSCTFLSCKTVEFYSKPYGILPQDFNLGQIYCWLARWPFFSEVFPHQISQETFSEHLCLGLQGRIQGSVQKQAVNHYCTIAYLL